MSEHTPTPDFSEEDLAILHAKLTYTQAEAAHIVKCVNAHDALVAALRAVMNGQIGGQVDMAAARFERARAVLAKVSS